MPESTSPARFDQDARVVVAVVDPHGFTGRERHPQRTDVGRAGVVLSCRTETYDAGAPDEETIAFYEVLMDQGDVLEFVDFELKAEARS